jgi:hypothetical protein
MGNNERRVDKNSKDFKELFGLADRIAQAKNPQRWFDGVTAQEEGLDTTPEWKSGLQTLHDEMDKRLEGGIFRDAVEDLNIKKRVSPKK